MNARLPLLPKSLLIVFLLILIPLTSCANPPSEQVNDDVVVEEEEKPEVQVQAADQVVVEELPSLQCAGEELEAPDLKTPLGGKIWTNEMQSILPAEFFQWRPISCFPEKFKVYFTDDPTWGTSRLGQTEGETVWPDPEAAFPQVPLEPATQYWWKVHAWADGVEGPDSYIASFFTGPECIYMQTYLGPPELIAPLDGQTISSPSVMLRYKPGHPGCLPRFFLVNVQTSPDFSGTSLGTGATPQQAFLLSDLQDCMTYYWAVKAKHSPYSSNYPYSVPYSFTTDFEGTCNLSFALEATALQDLACYQGPNTNVYPILGYLLQGETAEIVAQSLDMNWWYIRNPDGVDYCVVRKDGTESEGSAEDIPLWNNPDTQPEPDGGSGSQGGACSSHTTPESCRLAGCVWDPNVRLDNCKNP